MIPRPHPHSQILNPLRERPRPEWWYPGPPGGGSGGKLIQGKLTGLRDGEAGTPFEGKKIGEVMVEVAGCGHASIIGTTVDVIDHSGCIFDYEFADLEDVWVWGSWGVAADASDPEKNAPCHWVADNRCCVAADG